MDVSSIPLGQSSRRTTIFIGPNPNPVQTQVERSQVASLETRRSQSSADSSKMHRTVDKGDYLLARGANPRTGVVTPGSHSAGGSQDQDEVTRAQLTAPESRWRQRDDQWISLDLGHPTSSSTPPLDRLPQQHPRPLRTPHKLAAGQRDTLTTAEKISPYGHSGAKYSPAVNSPTNMSATFHLRQHSHGIGFYPDTLLDNTQPPRLHDEMRAEHPLPRKLVESSPGRSIANSDLQGQSETHESTQGVLKKHRFETNLRSSSAPDPPRMRTFTPRDINKALPRIPRDSINQDQKTSGTDPFLDLPDPTQPANVPGSKISNISGHPLVEKELPCLPTSSGQSPLIRESTPARIITAEKNEESTKDLSRRQIATPQGPRGGDPAYPFIRSARPNYPIPPITRPHGPLGERPMPLPVYDNPPKHLSPLKRMAGPKAEGPRPMPVHGTRIDRRRDGFGQSLNTITIPTDMSMSKAGVPRAFRAGSTYLGMGQRTMDCGLNGFHQRPTHPGGSDMTMNTSMDQGTDVMMSIPLPRIRPRATTRPSMAPRAEAALVGPNSEPTHNRTNKIIAMACQPTWDITGLEAMRRGNLVGKDANLIPEPLKPRMPTVGGPTTMNEMQSDLAETTLDGLGLMRKCSRCHQGFVDVRLHNTDSVTPTFGPQKAGAGASEGTRKLHPKGRSLPVLPEGADASANNEAQGMTSPDWSKKADVVDDERDHAICCPDCCKQDCHEGCLGHPSPSPTPSPTRSIIWSPAQSTSSPSEVEEWGPSSSPKRGEKGRTNQLSFIKSALERSSKKETSRYDSRVKSKSGQIGSPKRSLIELSAQPRTPPVFDELVASGPTIGAVAAAASALGFRSRNLLTESSNKMQKSSRSPVLGIDMSPRKTSESRNCKAASGARLRVPTPTGLAISCSSTTENFNVSDNGNGAMELQVPSLGSLGGGAVAEMLLVPFEASKMWIRNHPHVLTSGWALIERGWQMGQIMTTTGWKLWSLVFVYSKTGQFTLSVAKGETAGGFVIDCARSMLYLLIFLAVSVFVMRVLRVVLGVMGIVGWCFKAVFWVLKGILRLGAVG